MRLCLPQALAAQIAAQTRAALPGECCGLVLGRRGARAAEVLALHPARNLSADPDRFAIAPEDQFAAQRRARAEGLAVIGCYHSHPRGPARPSAADLAGASEENFLWLIAAPGELAAFVYLGGSFCGADLVMSSS